MFHSGPDLMKNIAEVFKAAGARRTAHIPSFLAAPERRCEELIKHLSLQVSDSLIKSWHWWDFLPVRGLICHAFNG
ncbi:hypothetical protein [Streptomyces sp. NPDC048643]|uniref:hypothetical protein n=1 Tax=Streptomyces sp. NPDC048643 TaxID=3155637 RepID=UPI003436C338